MHPYFVTGPCKKAIPKAVTRNRPLPTNSIMAVQLTVGIAASGWDDEPIDIQWQQSM
jgi:hypothetical protein